MNIILLSGGSGKRLWPLSNETRSKQFLKLIKNDDHEAESMVQRVYRQIRAAGIDANIVIATGKSQVDSIQSQLGSTVDIVQEPERRDTFPAIALASSYLALEKQLPQLNLEGAVVQGDQLLLAQRGNARDSVNALIRLDLPLLNIRALPNPALQPETSRGYELGLRREQGAITFSVAGLTLLTKGIGALVMYSATATATPRPTSRPKMKPRRVPPCCLPCIGILRGSGPAATCARAR